MAYPFFSLSKSHRVAPIDFCAGTVSIRVEAVPDHGMATIWDADILIWAAMVTYFSVMGVAIASFIPTPLRLVWNASASVPVGLYDLNPPRDLRVGDLVAVMPDKPLADFMVERGYIGRGVPLMKHVAALPGQTVCRTGNAVTIDTAPFGDALDRDKRGRELPVWQGCRRIADSDIFLMNPDVPDSLDGRYFGPIPARTVIGKATPLYTDKAGDGRFVWRAQIFMTTR